MIFVGWTLVPVLFSWFLQKTIIHLSIKACDAAGLLPEAIHISRNCEKIILFSHYAQPFPKLFFLFFGRFTS
jgi:hypothetical protein